MARVKGSVFTPRMNFVKLKGDPGAWDRVLAALSPGLREALQKGIMVSHWYPFEYYVELSRVIDQVLGHGDQSLIPELGRFSADESLRGIYKLFYQVGSVNFIIKRATQVWKQYFENGSVQVTIEAPFRVRLALADMEVTAHEHCMSVMGWVQRTVELSGGRDVHLTMDKCRDRGAQNCEFVVTWQE